MAGSAMPTTVASIEAIADPSTVASSTHRPGPLAYRRLPGWLEVASGVPNAPTSPFPPRAAREGCHAVRATPLSPPPEFLAADSWLVLHPRPTSVRRLVSSDWRRSRGFTWAARASAAGPWTVPGSGLAACLARLSPAYGLDVLSAPAAPQALRRFNRVLCDLIEAGRLGGPRGVRGQRGAGRARPGSIVAVTRTSPPGRHQPGVRAGLGCCCHLVRGLGPRPCAHGPRLVRQPWPKDNSPLPT